MSESNVNVLVGIPTGDKSAPGSSYLFQHWLKIASHWGQMGVSVVTTSEGPPSLTRDYLCRTFLADEQYTHLLMLDSDHLHPVDIVERLTRWVGHATSPQVISALNYQRKEPYRPAAFFFDGPTLGLMHLATWPQGLVKVDAVGGSALLIAREVLEKLPEPWFDFHYLPMGEGVKPRFIGEDIWFSKKLKDLGVDIYVDTTTTCPHAGEMFVDERHFRAWVQAQPEGKLTDHQVDTNAFALKQ